MSSFLPEFRVKPSEPFQVTGLDYTGAINVKNGSDNKVYIVLFTCAVTRAIHLEIVSNLTVDAFLNAFRRFCSRQGYPQLLLSDNATTFVGASSYLQELEKSSTIQSHLADVRCRWKFIPARAPWFGAIWERAIGIIKAGLKKVLGRALVTVEELNTVLLEIEATVNDRPLTYVSSNMEEVQIITPSHLLRGRRLRTFPKEMITEEEISDPTIFGNRSAVTHRYRFITKLSTDLWKLWTNEYLLALRETHRCLLKSSNRWPAVGDVVLIKDEGPRIHWKLGQVVELCPGPDYSSSS